MSAPGCFLLGWAAGCPGPDLPGNFKTTNGQPLDVSYAAWQSMAFGVRVHD